MRTIDLRKENISQLPYDIMDGHADVDSVQVIFADNTMGVSKIRPLVINLILWDPNYQLGILPIRTDYTAFRSVTTDVVREQQTVLYERAVVERPNVPHMRIVELYLYNIDKLSNFIQRYLGNFMPSIDGLGLAQLLANDAVAKIIKTPINEKLGTNVCETILKRCAGQLETQLRTLPGSVNCLYPYMRAQTLKSNQIPQFLHAYGTRSDIDNTMMRHVVTHSAFEGLQSVADYAIEYLSAKKAIKFSHDVIKTSQYTARKLRLVSSSIVRVYPGSCGSEGWIPYTIPSDYAKNYYERIIVDDDGSRVVLTKENISKYLDKQVRLVSQFACRHTDGLCEHCAGYGRDRLIRYIPPDIHIGILSVFQLASVISQKILSTKHLVIGVTVVYILSEIAKKYLFTHDGAIYWLKDIPKSLDGLYIRVPRRSLQQIADLNCRSMPNVESFSSIAFFELIKDGEIVDRVDMSSGAFIPYFSKDMIKFLKQHIKDIVVEKTYIDLPIAGFDRAWPMFNFTALNDDMMSFITQLTEFLGKSISNHTSVVTCMENFSRLVYKKTSMNSFFLETVLRAHMITSETDYSTPIVTDPFNVHFGKLADVISQRTVTGKFAFERMNEYIRKPDTPLIAKPAGLFGPLFGFVN